MVSTAAALLRGTVSEIIRATVPPRAGDRGSRDRETRRERDALSAPSRCEEESAYLPDSGSRGLAMRDSDRGTHAGRVRAR